MGQPYCTGFVAYFIKLPGGTPTFFGTTEGVPTVDMDRRFAPVMNDIAGPMIPLDYIYAGEEGIVSYVLTRFNHPVLTAIEAVFGGQAQTTQDIGSLMIAEGLTADLWMRYEFAGRASMVGMPAGKHFPACLLLGPDRWEGGNNPEKVHHIWKACRKFDPVNKVFNCWDENLSAVAGLAIN